jgi:hypothetical protein
VICCRRPRSRRRCRPPRLRCPGRKSLAAAARRRVKAPTTPAVGAVSAGSETSRRGANNQRANKSNQKRGTSFFAFSPRTTLLRASFCVISPWSRSRYLIVYTLLRYPMKRDISLWRTHGVICPLYFFCNREFPSLLYCVVMRGRVARAERNGVGHIVSGGAWDLYLYI